MVPLEILPLPRPLDRFGTAFPLALAYLYANAYTPRRGVVLDPLAYPWSAADAAERADRRGVAKSREPLGESARRAIALAPAGDEILAALDRVGESALVGTPHRVAMREVYGSTCATCRGPVIVEAFLWERDAPAPTKKAFRCGICAREGHALLIEAVTEDDERSSQRLDQRGMAYWQFVERFGLDPNAQALGETTAALYTPRNLTALMATLRAVETAVPASPARDVLLLCVLEILISGSRLNTLAGRGAPLRIEKGRARRSHASQWREANVWLVYVPHADLASIAAVALAGAGAGYRLRGITYQRDALTTGAASGSGAAAVCDFDRDVPLLRDQGAADASAIEEAIRAGVREVIRSRGEPVATDRAAVAALESLATHKLLAPLTLARPGGVSELETFLDHFRSALADAARSGIVKIDLDGAAAEHAHDTTVYSVTDPVDATPLDDRLEWGVWGLLSASRDVETRTLLRRAYGLFRDVETPDRELVERCIAAYGHQGDEGRWRLRDEDALVRRQADQTLLAIQLVDAGRRLGFKVHVGRDIERRGLPEAHLHRGAVLGDLMTREEQVADVSRVSGIRAEALEYIDVVWYDKGRMVFLWQLEWTARLHRSVVALGEGVPDEDRVFRFFAIADERRGLAEFKLRRAAGTAEIVRRRGWRFVKWGPLRPWAKRPAVARE